MAKRTNEAVFLTKAEQISRREEERLTNGFKSITKQISCLNFIFILY
jgi:hypothetical protein